MSQGPKFMAELIGAFGLVFFGAGAVLQQNVTQAVGITGIAVAHGLAILVAVYALGAISGGHFNPCVTFGMAVTRRISWGDAFGYWIAQLAGASIAAWLLSLAYPSGASDVHLGAPVLGASIGPLLGMALELSGVFFMLWLMHQAFSTVSILGVIVLSGMDIVTAILMIDLILHYRKSGLPRNEAVATASPQRLRPILMTSLITIFVMAQVAFIPKSGLDAYQPLGTTIIGGLIVGTVLSLLDIPIMHTIVDDVVRWAQVKILKVDPASLPPVEKTP